MPVKCSSTGQILLPFSPASAIKYGMTSFVKRTTWILILCAFFAAPKAVPARDAILTNVTVSNTRDDLLLYLNLEGAFSAKVKRTVLSGVPTTFSFFVNLNRVRNLWFDEQISEITVTHTIKYDNLRKEFIVSRSWKNNIPEITKSFQEARRLMTGINSLKVIPLKQLQKGEQYQLRVKAQISKKTLPFHLHYVLFFMSLWDIETDWYTIDFIY